MKKIRIIAISALACLALLTAGGVLNSFAQPFSDISGHWAQSAIEKWSGYEIIEGFDGQFKPDDPITRAEMAVIINRLMAYPEAGENQFTDLEEDWYKDAILKAAANGVLMGYEGQARPNDVMTREEAAVMLARALHVEPKQAETPFSDQAAISDWAVQYIAAMAEKQYVRGFEDGTFAPQERMTRAYAVALLNNTIGGFYNKAGTYTDQVEGLVLVNAPGVIFRNMQIGDIVLAPGVGNNRILLQGTSTIQGDRVILAGSIGSSSSGIIGGGGTGGSGSGGSGGSGGGSTVTAAPETSIIVNSSYEGQSGTVVYERRQYTHGTNAFGNLRDAVSKAAAFERQVTITLTGDLTEENTVEISANNLVLIGGGHTLTFTKSADVKKDGLQIINAQEATLKDLTIQMDEADNSWHGSYGIQAYQTQVTLNGVTVSGADAGILLNGATANITGRINVSNNEFGGIELAKGAETDRTPAINDTVGQISNTTEAEGLPTIWVDNSDQFDAVVNVQNMFAKELVKNGKVQQQFYLNEDNVPQDDTVQAVEDENGLQSAINDENVEFIRLTEDITAQAPLDITRDVVINGQGHTITAPPAAKRVLTVMPADVTRSNPKVEISNLNVAFSGESPTAWQGLYGIQIYRTSGVTLRNISATNGNAGILINGSEVALEGTVDVSGNTFGGIELSKGSGVTETPSLSGAVASIKNTTEAPLKPTIWTDGADVPASCVNITGITVVEQAKPNQNHFYLNSELAAAEAKDETALRTALQNENAKIINLTADITVQTPIEITRNLTLDGVNHTITAPVSAKNVVVMKALTEGGISSARIRNLKVAFEGASGPADWKSAYGLQIYRAAGVVLENVSAKYGNAAILVNGSEVTLEGEINISDNTFGGIEVSKGAGVTEDPVLKANSVNLVNMTEAHGKPSVWTDQIGAEAVQLISLTSVPYTENGKNQVHFYINSANASAPAPSAAPTAAPSAEPSASPMP